ncbi:hypothetical protein PT312_01790 [Metamycoplasma hyosynoviae]|uniref:Uncharacterized protein n=2 Tax=Metamycoplasma hyosynoviae TaxID=29559 RepID=A0A063YFT5_9BACT|nr:hypothetical protein [Metamycoplasma hyosynoviae]KDE45428.1 hypothetical protein NPL4_01480 [Metamycoplasma hyosynoviae]MDD1373911.1 hypothetical protein [Metamycoplasma hyosynoviae]MDD1376390.1 hypothetical protein [Metamycoplasma hyosynoviae]MDD1377013.1 hypothetical protein [Metamycoplasma hyosynoviae]MDD7837652.1 hypothetical protein [Metamycoplasma hyosynoviae]
MQIKEWIPIVIPLITSLIGLILTIIFTSIAQSKKVKYIKTRVEFLERENANINLDFKLYKEKTDNWAFDMKIDLKKASDENMLLIKKIEMYKTNSNVEYNQELENKLREYLKASDTLSNELLKQKDINTELSITLESYKFQNEQLQNKVSFLEKELNQQSNFLNNLKKFEQTFQTLKFPEKVSQSKPPINENIDLSSSFNAYNEPETLKWENTKENKKGTV